MEEINLLNIVSINEDNLKKNFNLLLNRIQKQAELIENLNEKVDQTEKSLTMNIDSKCNQL